MIDLGRQIQEAIGGSYRIEREIGAGGMAVVFLAHDTRHDRTVAIKVLRPELGASIGAERFLREIRIAAKLSHPHVLPLHDSGASGDLFWYVMPFVEGESLRDRLVRERQLPIEDAVRIATQTARALAYAHREGIVHRDIKPENILLHGGEAVVADFGIACAVAAGADRITATGVSVGTVAYMSPEQATADAIDGRSDIYSLGCVLYEMLTGHPPFLGGSAAEVLARTALDPAPPVTTARSTVPPGVARALMRSLAKSPADRFATASDFADALDAGLAAQSTLAVAEPTTRRRWIAASGALLAVAVIAAVALRPRSAPASTSEPRVAVMYFDSQSPDSADAYLADGLTEEIIQRLGEVPRLEVKSRYAVRRFRGGAVTDPATLGKQLGVTTLINGNVRHSQDRLRVGVELVNAATGQRVWGQQFEGADADLLSLEGELAQSIATAVAGRLEPDERARLGSRPTSNAAAYDHFLRGNYVLAQRTSGATAEAITEYETAMRADSAFTRPLARTALGYALFVAWEWPHPTLSWDSLLARGSRIAAAAVARDSMSSDAWLAAGMFDWFTHPESWKIAQAAQERAVALDPTNVEAVNVLGVTLFCEGKDSLAAAAFHRALAIETKPPKTLLRLAEVDLVDGQRDAGLRSVDSVLSAWPSFASAYADRAEMRAARGDLAGARKDADALALLSRTSSSSPDPQALALLAEMTARRGDLPQAKARLDTLRKIYGTFDGLHPNAATTVAAAVLATGDRDGALRVLERERPRGILFWWNLRWPQFDPLRADPRFRAVVARSPFR